MGFNCSNSTSSYEELVKFTHLIEKPDRLDEDLVLKIFKFLC